MIYFNLDTIGIYQEINNLGSFSCSFCLTGGFQCPCKNWANNLQSLNHTTFFFLKKISAISFSINYSLQELNVFLLCFLPLSALQCIFCCTDMTNGGKMLKLLILCKYIPLHIRKKANVLGFTNGMILYFMDYGGPKRLK